jgi:hypothetical protein
MIRYALFALLALSACQKSTNENHPKSIDLVKSEIESMIQPRQCATKSQDCRLRFIAKGDGCGPFYIYNINDVDSAKLAKKFSELEKLKEDYSNNNPLGPICDYAIPDSLYLKDCKCVGGYKNR